MVHPPQFDESEVITLIDRLVRVVPGQDGGKAKVRQITQRQERYRGGYDAVVSTVLPFYVQAKTASFFTAASKSEIIIDRANLGASSSPGAFAFYLRKHRDTDEPLQHNALYWMSLRSTAAYVCPTYTSEQSLDKHLDAALRVKRQDIWAYKETSYHEAHNGMRTNIRARHFSGLITIVPHRLVDTYLHRYSYINNANPEVVFHSDPESVPSSKSFSEFISNIELAQKKEDDINNLNDSNTFKSVDATRKLLMQWIEESFIPNDMGLKTSLADISLALNLAGLSSSTEFERFDAAIKYLTKLDWLDLAAFWGAMLSEKYSIRQYIAMEFIE